MDKIHRLSAIAAIGRNRELGKQNQLIWRIADDLKRVHRLSSGHPIIMGRKTYESIGRPLPNRTNVVITTDATYECDGCIIVHSLDEALQVASKAEGNEEIFIFGGASIYEAALPQTDRLYLTLIDATDPEADTFFPEYQDFDKVVESEDHHEDGLVFQFLTLERSLK